tara:strand:+ start:4119 stop:5507 length:1389 start_codon:yes stop_codon:yes gene_type:complete
MGVVKWFKTNTFLYTVYGVGFGCCFPILGSACDLFRLNQSLTLVNLIHIQLANPIHFIIDTAPFFLGWFAFIAGKKQDQLLKKNLEIVNVLRVKEEFFANMSHEIRTPMNGVIGVIDLLQKTTKLDQHQSKYLSIVAKSSDHMMAIIDDILTISKLEANKIEVKYSTSQLNKILEQERDLFKELAEQNQIHIDLDFDDGIPDFLEMGEIRVRQIVGNLLSNAIKFSYDGRVLIRSSLVAVLEKSFTVKIEVIDSGQGILEADQKLLFNVFQQLDQSSTKRIKGTGLGLSIAKRMAELMGGEIGVVSEIGKGSNFWFTFVARAAASIDGASTPKHEISSCLNNKHILIVDDMALNVLVAEAMLMQLGCTCDTAENGVQAVNKFKENSYDLILMDIQMPEMDGVEATKQIRLINKLTPPIVALSANAMDGHKELYIKSGLDDYLSKPIVIDSLRGVLEKWLLDN